MPKKRADEVPTPEQIAAQEAGQKALRDYFHGEIGRQKDVANASGLYASMLSRMACGHTPINLETAIALEVATKGELRAEVLCPLRAEVLNRFVNGRQGTAEA